MEKVNDKGNLKKNLIVLCCMAVSVIPGILVGGLISDTQGLGNLKFVIQLMLCIENVLFVALIATLFSLRGTSLKENIKSLFLVAVLLCAMSMTISVSVIIITLYK